MTSVVDRAYIVPGKPHILLAPERSPKWQALREAYDRVRSEIEASDADMILYFSTQWFAVIGHLFQADPKPKWTHVDPEWHDLGSIPYEFTVDSEFAQVYADCVKEDGYHVATVNYHGFPIDTGTVVAQKLLNPDNRLPASMVSCNIYADKNEMLLLGQAATRALARSGKKAVVVLVSSLSNRLELREIDPGEDHISSAKDHEWNLKVCELLGEGRLEDVAQCARDFAREANADMGFKGIWWLSGLCGQHNGFEGKFYDYQPVWGTGAALVRLVPRTEVRPVAALKLETESNVIQNVDCLDPSYRGKDAPKALADSVGLIETAEAGPENRESQAASADTTRIMSDSAPEPVGPYPHARREGDLIFLSGVGPRQKGQTEIPGATIDADGRLVDYDIEVQTRAVIENVADILRSSGSSLEQVIDIQVFLIDMDRDFQIFNRVYAETFAEIGPTRTTVAVTALPTPIAVEFKVVARSPLPG